MNRYANFKKDTKRFKKITDAEEEVKYMCKCGHREIIGKNRDKTVCSWCGKYIFKSKKDEDLYRIKERLKGDK